MVVRQSVVGGEHQRGNLYLVEGAGVASGVRLLWVVPDEAEVCAVAHAGDVPEGGVAVVAQQHDAVAVADALHVDEGLHLAQLGVVAEEDT